MIPLACDLVYPCPAESADLGCQIPKLRQLADRVGYSDHTTSTITGAVAVALGASVLEKHVTLDPGGDAPDDKMALTVDQATEYLAHARAAGTLLSKVEGDPQEAARIGARRSAYARYPLEAGQVLKSSDVAWLRPCPADGIPPYRTIAGRTLACAVGQGERIPRDALV